MATIQMLLKLKYPPIASKLLHVGEKTFKDAEVLHNVSFCQQLMLTAKHKKLIFYLKKSIHASLEKLF